MRRVLIVSIFTLLFSLVCFWIVKLWGRSQIYTEYKHPMLSEQALPILFIKPSPENLDAVIKSNQNVYLDVSTTLDQKLVMPRRPWNKNEKPIRNSNLAEIKNDVVEVKEYKDFLKSKKIIFNLVENAQAGHEIFFYNIQQIDLGKGENFIVTSPFEAMIKALKENQPELVYGTTTPEILKILAMNSMHLVEATTIRADVIIYPLMVRGQTFYVEDLLSEFERRHKKIIVGPISADEKEKAVSLNPYGLIIQN
jgi:hypothetical protein